MTGFRLAAPLFCAAALAGCTASPSPVALNRDAQGLGGGVPSMFLPVDAGRVVAVRRTLSADGLSQQIVLDGPRGMVGENRITSQALISAFGGRRGEAADGPQLSPPTDSVIEAEMKAQLPGLRMRVSAEGGTDALGPFGYATGSSGRLACIYAWQYVPPEQTLTALDNLVTRGPAPVSLRVRLCRDATVASLVADMPRMILSPLASTGALPEAAAPALVGKDALDAALGPLAQPAGGGDEVAPRPRRHRVMSSLQHLSHAEAHPARRVTLHPHLAVAPRTMRGGPDTTRSAVPHIPLPADVEPHSTAEIMSFVPPTPHAASTDDVLPMPR